MQNPLEPLGGIDVPKIADFWDWVKETFTPSYQNEVQQYLSQSVDLFDLEQRMKVLRVRGML